MLSFKYFSKKFKAEDRKDGFSYADFSSRYMSLLFDLFVLILILKLVSFGFFTFVKFKNQNSEYIKNISSEVLYKYKFGIELDLEERKFLNSKKREYFLFQSISFLSIFFYFFFSFYYFSGTLGNIVFNFRFFIEDEDSKELKKITLKVCFLRILGLILLFITLFFGFFSIFFDSKKQGIHDKISGVVAIKGKKFFDFFDNDKQKQNLIRIDIIKILNIFIKDFIQNFLRKIIFNSRK